MSRSQRLTLRDVRAVYLLVGECRELGADPVAWQTHLLRGLAQVIGSGVGAIIESDPAAAPPPADDPFRPTSIIDHGWPSPAASRAFQSLVRAGNLGRNPMLSAMLARSGQVRTATRRELLPDRAYYGNDYVAGYIRATGLDDFIGMFYLPAPGHAVNLGLNRCRGERPFGPRQRRLTHLMGLELVGLHGNRLASGAGPSVARLAPRLRQVLLCLFEGDSEKQAALRLGVAPATVHEYVRRLHRLFGVSSRGELLARCAPLLPALRAASD